MKKSIKNTIVILLSVTLFCTMFLGNGIISFANSEEALSSDFEFTDGCFNAYTDSEYYYDAKTQTEDTTQYILPDNIRGGYYGIGGLDGNGGLSGDDGGYSTDVSNGLDGTNGNNGHGDEP